MFRPETHSRNHFGQYCQQVKLVTSVGAKSRSLFPWWLFKWETGSTHEIKQVVRFTGLTRGQWPDKQKNFSSCVFWQSKGKDVFSDKIYLPHLNEVFQAMCVAMSLIYCVISHSLMLCLVSPPRLLLPSVCCLSYLSPHVSVTLLLSAWQCGTCQSQWRTWGLTPFLSLLVWPQTSMSEVLSWSWWKRHVGYCWPLIKMVNKTEVYGVPHIRYLSYIFYILPMSYVQEVQPLLMNVNSAPVCLCIFVFCVCRDQAGLVGPCVVVGAKATVVAADSLDFGEIWHPRWCQAAFHAATQTLEFVSPERHHL